MHLICDAEARITPTPRPYALFEPAQPTVCGQVRFLNHGLQRFLYSREVIATPRSSTILFDRTECYQNGMEMHHRRSGSYFVRGSSLESCNPASK
ncbi:uncharacterized protein CIMG_13069 [Coccidioides immitis RS]|uniref:Uncharacterized protein n=1 Tax=Coccidioides immitis (strain RS) TaxID=246410 RepID=J3K8J0_COCIM|nr:uncharacterized protein CIMG_13069 [Coccidioides immitis RS]EAS31142.3 hypothetical protein CIMG_13069 [Coccidioides immitis RS]TPX23993.1 hypothetical protein DIZ76_013336 [Coccidioides immitis]